MSIIVVSKFHFFNNGNFLGTTIPFLGSTIGKLILLINLTVGSLLGYYGPHVINKENNRSKLVLAGPKIIALHSVNDLSSESTRPYE